MTRGPSRFAERYASATRSSNLKPNPRGVSAVDTITALAWADRSLASPMYRAFAANDADSVRDLRRVWEADCLRRAFQRRWALRGVVRAGGSLYVCNGTLPTDLVKLVAQQSVDYWLNAVCGTCEGRRFMLLSEQRGASTEGRDVLSDAPCRACKGQGVRPLVASPAELKPLVEKAVGILNDLFMQFGKSAIDRLR